MSAEAWGSLCRVDCAAWVAIVAEVADQVPMLACSSLPRGYHLLLPEGALFYHLYAAHAWDTGLN